MLSCCGPDVRTEQLHIDILTAHFVCHPDWFDVVGSNLFGDIFSDLGPAVVGSIGIAPSASPSTREILRSLSVNWRMVAIATMLVTMTTVSFYMITAYTPTFGSSVLHLGNKDSLIVTLWSRCFQPVLASGDGRSFR